LHSPISGLVYLIMNNITLLAALLCYYCAICSHAAFLSRFGKRYQSERPQVTLPRFGKRPSYQLAHDALNEMMPSESNEAAHEVDKLNFQPNMDRAKQLVRRDKWQLDGSADMWQSN